MKQQTKLDQKQEQEHVAEQQTQAQAAKEFSNPDELLRFDAAQTAVPSEIAQRLQKSAANIPPPPLRKWWKNLFGG
ncbi:MAG: hypothetical protein ABSE90_08455 [Verrucomicrobiota bacterium]|jgi:hypothetical protein